MLKIEHLMKTYHPNSEPALKDISLSVESGEFVAVLGLSGAGKSTLIRCINRLVEPTRGIILWEGMNVLDKKGKELREYRRQIGMIFQTFNLIDRFDTLTNVLIGQLGNIPFWRAATLTFNVTEKELAYYALERVGLKDFANRRADQLSGGQRQRVAIARALMQMPKLILGDEPVASLDPLTSRGIMSLLAEINKEEGISIIINLHDVQLAKEFSTRIIGIAKGKVVYDGSPEGVDDSVLRSIYLNN